jgi:hypothetical protein
MSSNSFVPPRRAANPALVSAVKAIVAMAREGNLDAAYGGYKELFRDGAFSRYEAHDRRQALRLLVHSKGNPDPPIPAMVEAHRAALEPLGELVSQHGEPADYEMLGMCHLVVGATQSAGEAFRAGLAIERERNLQSALCGAFMRRISAL